LELIREIMTYRSALALDGDLIDKVKDTGSLRSDLLHLITLYQKIYTAVGPETMNAMLFEMSQNNARLPDIKNDIVLRNVQVMEKLVEFAKARGEHIKTLSDTALALPIDLIRISFLWGRQIMGQTELEKLVDEILLPVLKG